MHVSLPQAYSARGARGAQNQPNTLSQFEDFHRCARTQMRIVSRAHVVIRTNPSKANILAYLADYCE